MKNLLVALDGSSYADASLPVAVGLARRLRAGLHLVSVLDTEQGRPPVGGAPFPDRQLALEHEAEWRAAIDRYLAAARDRVAALPDAPAVHTALLTGSVADTLLAFARDVAASQIIVTTHGRGGLSRAWLGSVTEALLRSANVPFVAVRPSDTPWPPHTMPDWQLRRLLVPLDGAADSEQVLEHVQALAADGTECVLMRAVSPLHPMLRAIATGAEFERDLAEQRTLVSGYLQHLEADLLARGLSVTHCAHEALEPPRAICECADSLDVDLIVLATRGRGVVGRVLLGSVADKVLRSTNRPVMLCHLATEATPP